MAKDVRPSIQKHPPGPSKPIQSQLEALSKLSRSSPRQSPRKGQGQSSLSIIFINEPLCFKHSPQAVLHSEFRSVFRSHLCLACRRVAYDANAMLVLCWVFHSFTNALPHLCHKRGWLLRWIALGIAAASRMMFLREQPVEDAVHGFTAVSLHCG